MDMSAISAGISGTDAASIQQSYSVAVLKKSMDAESSAALQLIQSIPQMAPQPSHLGSNVDLRA